jgi:hypothetical protein
VVLRCMLDLPQSVRDTVVGLRLTGCYLLTDIGVGFVAEAFPKVKKVSAFFSSAQHFRINVFVLLGTRDLLSNNVISQKGQRFCFSSPTLSHQRICTALGPEIYFLIM